MKTTIKILSTGLMVLTLALTSCSKDSVDGAVGPQGEQGVQGIQGEPGPAGQDGEAQGVPGPTGPKGDAGADGANGADGADGNANVITSEWIPMTFVDNSLFTAFEIEASTFPEDIRDSYAILVYVRRVSFADAVHVLPADFTTYTMDYVILTDNTLRVLFDAESGSSATPPDNASLRYVLMEATGSSGKSNQQNTFEELKSSGVDIKDYKAVMDYFGLEQ